MVGIKAPRTSTSIGVYVQPAVPVRRGSSHSSRAATSLANSSSPKPYFIKVQFSARHLCRGLMRGCGQNKSSWQMADCP